LSNLFSLETQTFLWHLNSMAKAKFRTGKRGSTKGPVDSLASADHPRKADIVPHDPALEQHDLNGPDPGQTEPDSLPTRGQSSIEVDDMRPLEELCRTLTVPAVRALERIVKDSKARNNAVISAANSLLDRGWGKPKERLEVTRKTDVSSMSVAELERIVKEAKAKTQDEPQEEKVIPPGVAAILPS
jgi:hypothetical protein